LHAWRHRAGACRAAGAAARKHQRGTGDGSEDPGRHRRGGRPPGGGGGEAARRVLCRGRRGRGGGGGRCRAGPRPGRAGPRRRGLGIALPRARDMGPVLIAWAVSLLLLIFESDIGTSALFFGMFLIMLYVATQRTSWLLIGTSLFLVGAFLASQLVSHVALRFSIWLHPFTYPNVFCGSPGIHVPCVPSYQLAQGMYGLGFGGILGTGLGHGQPYLTPLVQSDFIITAFGEELGLTGLMALLLIYGLIVERGLRAAVAVRDPFAKLLATG